MPIPGQKKERVWHDPPMVDPDPQVQESFDNRAREELGQRYAEVVNSPQWFFFMAIFSTLIVGTTYAMLKWHPEMTPEEIAFYMAVIPFYFLLRGALKIIFRHIAKKIQ